ncbi:MAG: hypothetical protein AAFX52_05375 [Pseudomonadota bacterium]
MTGQPTHRDGDPSLARDLSQFVFDTSSEAVARRSEDLALAIPDAALEGVRRQLSALRSHAEAAGLMSPDGDES